MKIAVASKENEVSQHFGHCEHFNFYEIVDGEVITEKFVENPGHDCKGLPQFLKDNDIEFLISGGIGKGAVQNCEVRGIKVVSGATGRAKEVALQLERGELESTGELCSHHDDHHGHHH